MARSNCTTVARLWRIAGSAAILTMGGLIGCASVPEKPQTVEMQIKCAPSRFEQCADHCAAEDAGDPLIWENKTDWACFCKRPKDKS